MQGKNELVSIIIPVYNAETYIDRCLNSALFQTYYNVEVICVNDGSNDRSLDILRSFERKDDRIKVIDKKNGGVSAARNDGIKASQGDYILFIDADDWIDSKTVEVTLEYAKKYNAEQVRYAYAREFNDSKRVVYSGKVYNTPQYIERKDFFSEHIIDDFIETYNYNSIWMFLIKREFLINNNIHFDETTFYAEDFLFTMNIYEKLNKVVYLPYSFYHYMNNVNSITTKVSVDHVEKKIQNAIKNYSKLENFCNAFECLNETRKTKIENRIKQEVLLCIKTIYSVKELLPKEDRINIMQFAIDECKKNKLDLEINSKEKYDIENLIIYRYLNKVKSIIKRIIYR